MFRHGVCYLERGGPVDGPFELSFRRAEMNDVLKSLAVWVQNGNARVTSVAFEAPADPEATLAERRLSVDPASVFTGLIETLRGRLVRVQAGDQQVEGLVLGTEQRASGDRLVLRTDTGTVELVATAAITRLEALEGRSKQDLEFMLDRGRAAMAGERRALRVVLAGKADDLRVAYVLPAAAWRVSYRLVRQADTTLLMGWGIVHNPSDEDLDDIELTLTSGQPVSFVVDLYDPLEIERVVVEETERTVSAPSASASAASLSGGGPLAPPVPKGPLATVSDQGPRAGMGTIIMMAAAEVNASNPRRHEHFEYRVPGRVSLRRGQSAMVPIVAATVAARVERVWREGRGAHPDVALAFQNSTLAALVEGPAVIYDSGSYVGEAMLPFALRGEEVRLLYATDTSLRCRRASQGRVSVTGVRLTPGAIIETQERQETHLFQVESDHLDETSVIFELPRHPERTLVPDPGAQIEPGMQVNRLRLPVPPQGKAEARLTERWPDARRVEYEQLTARDLGAWLEQRLLDRGTHDALAGVLAAWAQAAGFDEQRGRLEREQQDALLRQTKLREQVSVMGDSGQEGAIRLRYVKDIERDQDRIIACESELRKAREGADRSRRYAAQTLSVLVAHAERLP
jgi:hypothetical protein